MYLNCKTWFSLRYGMFQTEELVKTAVDNGVGVLALTNINSTADTWDFVDFCEQAGVKPVAGVEVRNDDTVLYLLLARNNDGFRAINLFLSDHLEAKKPFPAHPGLAENVLIIYPIGKADPAQLAPNEFIGVQTTEITKLYGHRPAAYPTKYVIRQPVTFQDKARYNGHRLLRCIDKNILLSRQEPKDYAGSHERFIPPGELMAAFAAYPSMITATLQLLESCSISLDFKSDKTKKQFSASGEDDRAFLKKLAMEGLVQRYGRNNRVARERVIKELDIIHTLGFNAYFLDTWEILRYARSRGFFYVGRGSGANSIVAYCLQITDVDPIVLDLYFERFLNPYRASPPDFDLDFSHRDRDEMIDYIFKRFGADHVALLGSYTTFQERAVIRELGKVFGLPKAEIDALERPGANFGEHTVYQRILRYGGMLKDYPNHLSIHAGGILISEKPIREYSATEIPPKGFRTTQIDMYVAEKIGLYKLDILSQRGLGHIKEAVDLVRENQGELIDIHAIERFKSDPRVADKIRAADTIGCFYIESPAMRQLLTKLECDDYLTLVAASSIIRPGVAQSGMMRQYIYRYHYPDKFEYLHPKMEELLKETYGVMVYQEDVIKIAHHFGGLDMGEADVLRRAMSGKYRGHHQFIQIREKYFANCKAYGYTEELAKEVWRQIESFGGYSFSKAHSASYAVESYQSLFLKTYYPKEFMVAVINNFGGFYSRELYFHELRRTGVQIEAPCVNESTYLTSIRGNVVWVGFVHMLNLESKLVERIIEERINRGPYLHLQDFIERTSCPLEQLTLLVRIGAFRFTGRNKKELLWSATYLQKSNDRHVPAHASLFKEQPFDFQLPVLEQTRLEDAYDEIEILGFALSPPWDLVDADLDAYRSAHNLKELVGLDIEVIAYYVTNKPVRTKNGTMMFFGTFLDKEGNWLDTVHFPGTFKYTPFEGSGFYVMKGKVKEEFGVYTMEVRESKKVGHKNIED